MTSSRDVIAGWADAEIAPWTTRAVSADVFRDHLRWLNRKKPFMTLFRLKGDRVHVLPKTQPRKPGHAYRTQRYAHFFAEVVRDRHLDLDTVMAVSVTDGDFNKGLAPTFAFQKLAGSASILIPDIDFLGTDFYDAGLYFDGTLFRDKLHAAVFSGGITGRLADGEDVLNLPRLRATAYFRNHPRIRFLTPSLGNYGENREVVEKLQSLGFGLGARLSWEEMFKYRFLISMDGNGATCSRVAIALRSNSILIKYASDSLLYYFRGLQPSVHYLHVDADAEIDALLDADPAGEHWKSVAEAGTDFYNRFLTRDAVSTYTACLLRTYDGLTRSALSGVADDEFV